MCLFLASTSDASCSLTEKIKPKMQELASFLFHPQSSFLLIYLAFLYFLSLDPILFSCSLSSIIWSSVFNLFLSMVLLFSLKIGPRLTSQFKPHPEYQLNFSFLLWSPFWEEQLYPQPCIHVIAAVYLQTFKCVSRKPPCPHTRGYSTIFTHAIQFKLL